MEGRNVGWRQREDLSVEGTWEGLLRNHFSSLTAPPSSSRLPPASASSRLSTDSPPPVSILPVTYFQSLLADDPPLTGEVKSRKGKHFLLRHKEARGGVFLPPHHPQSGHSSDLTSRPVMTRGLPAHGLSCGGQPLSAGLGIRVLLCEVKTGRG